MTRKLAIAALFALAPLAALAQAPATLADLQTQNAVKLTKADLEALVPGAKNENQSRQGNNRVLTHGSGGRLMGIMHGAQLAAAGAPGEGKWRIEDDGRYCVDMTWSFRTSSVDEKWCAAIWKAGSDYYATIGDKPDTRAWKQVFKK
jgi:hypothetical protein